MPGKGNCWGVEANSEDPDNKRLGTKIKGFKKKLFEKNSLRAVTVDDCNNLEGSRWRSGLLKQRVNENEAVQLCDDLQLTAPKTCQ